MARCSWSFLCDLGVLENLSAIEGVGFEIGCSAGIGDSRSIDPLSLLIVGASESCLSRLDTTRGGLAEETGVFEDRPVAAGLSASSGDSGAACASSLSRRSFSTSLRFSSERPTGILGADFGTVSSCSLRSTRSSDFLPAHFDIRLTAPLSLLIDSLETTPRRNWGLNFFACISPSSPPGSLLTDREPSES